MNSIERLIKIFSEFPGIGPRQARRFVYFLLTRQSSAVQELVQNLEHLKDDVQRCTECGRFFERKHAGATQCSICSDTLRDHSTVMVVPRDIDLEAVEKNGVFNGTYFVLGGSLPILEKEPNKRIRVNDLLHFVERRSTEGLKEVIIAMNFNPEGENTSEYLTEQLLPFKERIGLKISHLGKGLSMGTELEYADPDTLKNALKNRS